VGFGYIIKNEDFTLVYTYWVATNLLPKEIQKSMFALAKWGAGAKPHKWELKRFL